MSAAGVVGVVRYGIRFKVKVHSAYKFSIVMVSVVTTKVA